ncbi:tripartite tricarboxylate transporter permease [Salibacterium aidingense]|uniref:tripartite tricarboxylate transporter permease n=1 Tax=Salibacterium aidingense TaxID=384933 RepID=UPI00040B5DB0|nr:tripartite tricarboxylate transporter permease [Salibacterium aidingense]
MLLEGFQTILTFSNILVIIVGVALGILVGSLPGLTATMTIALLLPFSFGLTPVASIVLMVSVFIGAIYGGSVAAIIVKIPGTPAAAATLFDGYPLAQKGEVGKALSTSVVGSFVGGIISTTALILFSPLLARIALEFSAAEFFSLALFGLSIIASVSGKTVLKGLMAGCLGLLVAMVGMDPVSAYPRYTFDRTALMNGFNLIPVLIGLFGASQVLLFLEDKGESSGKIKEKIKTKIIGVKETLSLAAAMIRSGAIGTMIGSIPGAGADIAAFVSYNEAKRWSKDKEQFGKGSLKGIAAPEAGNNGVTGGTMIPLLTFGIPGDAAAAVMLGAFLIHGLQPGPNLFTSDSDLVYGLFAGMLIANLFMLLFGLLFVRYFAKIISLDTKILMPIILVLCGIGSFSMNNSMFDVFVMLGFGVVGYFMTKLNVPLSPIILGIILGPMIEENFRRAMVLEGGNLSFLYSRPITVIFLSLALLTIISSLWSTARKTSQNNLQ